MSYLWLSSPRARAESARAVTGRRCPHSGTGQDFLARNGPNRTKTGVTRQRSERFGRAQRLNGANAEGYKRPVDKNRGPISKNGFSGRNPEFLAPQKKYTFQFSPCSGHDRAELSKGKSTLFPNKYQSYRVFGGVAIAKNGFSARFSRFGKTQKRSFLRKSGRDRLRWSPISFFWCPGYSSQVSSISDQN